MKIALAPYMHRLFGTLAEVGFDSIMTACVVAWEEHAGASSRRFMRDQMQRYVDKYWR